jgi:hypothetical protein
LRIKWKTTVCRLSRSLNCIITTDVPERKQNLHIFSFMPIEKHSEGRIVG